MTACLGYNKNPINSSEISGFHGSGYENDSLLGYITV
jgi:hypothetical protein